MEMTLDNLLHEIARLRIENLEQKQEIKRLKAKATAAGADREDHPRNLTHHPKANEPLKQP
jgi:hypothetical protein